MDHVKPESTSVLAQIHQLTKQLQAANCEVREEQLDGRRGGYCEIISKRYVFLDLAQGPLERLSVLREAAAKVRQLVAAADSSAEAA